ncbi:MASE1 domain-containing protein [Acidovorax radicis]|uniref:MASE1 domain-containing protein n=1 Tax=Acidovorax radicis TaxID=758826 RepID=UPI0039B00ABE|nr:MASE1 domain-containing protein [Acidovorax radicis]
MSLALAGVVASSPQAPGLPPLLLPTTGLALALWLQGGARLTAALLPGSALVWWLARTPPAVALSEALATAVAAALGAVLLRRQDGTDPRCGSVKAFARLLASGCGAAAGAGALVAATGLLLSGHIVSNAWAQVLLRWWLGSALGILLVTPLVLAWWSALGTRAALRRFPEGVMVLALAALAGQLIFLDWHSPVFSPVANAYWMFLFVTWAGARLGVAGTATLLCTTGLQAWWGAHTNAGFFANDLDASQGFGYWSYMAILSLVGMVLAAYLAELRRQRADLLIAAIAFECQEGLLITDTRGVVLRANQSFLRMSGHTASEVLGKTSHQLCAHPSDAPDPPPPHDDRHLPYLDVQRREWHRRQYGEPYPVWTAITPVTSARGRITHYVVAITDITDLRRQAEQRQEMEQRHRDALVREVHHRIKNNLQGIIGILRGFGQAHPQLDEPITEVVGQVQSISVIHGLQGRARMDQVRLCELTSAVAASIASLWQTPVFVDIPPMWQPCRVHQAEAVPVALMLNELILNAVKHGGRAHRDVLVALRKGDDDSTVRITISNPGQWPREAMAGHTGLELVAALMPRSGAMLTMEQHQERAVACLELHPPVIHAEPTESATA